MAAQKRASKRATKTVPSGRGGKSTTGARGVSKRSLSGSWTGYYVGSDLVPRNTDLALDQRGQRLKGEMSLVVDTKTGARAKVPVMGEGARGKITLNATLPKSAKVGTAVMMITGRLVEAYGDQVVLAITVPNGKLKDLESVGGIPLKGSFTLRSVALLEAAGDEGDPVWVEENS